MTLTKTQQQQFISKYKRATTGELYKVYKSCSTAKWRAYYRVIEQMRALRGYDLRITSHNSSIFCCAFLFSDPDTGEVKICYVTPYNNYYFDFLG